MQAVNDFLSNDIGYLHALRHAQPLPLPKAMEKETFNMTKVFVMLGIVGIGTFVIVFALKASDNAKEKKKNNH